MTGRDRVELDVRFRIDPLEPVEDGTYRHTPVVTSTVADMPLIIVRDLSQVDELMLGHCVAMLLTAAEHDEAERLAADLAEDDAWQASLQAERDHEQFKRGDTT